MNLLVTGGCGFIGSNFVRYWLEQHPEDHVVVYDKLTYAGRKENLHDLWGSPRLSLVVGDIGDLDLVRQTCQDNKIDLIVNFAAETHVDQSILGPLVFTDTNVRGTHVLLEVARELGIRLHHISTDEVYGHIKDGHQSRASNPMNWPPVASGNDLKRQMLIAKRASVLGSLSNILVLKDSVAGVRSPLSDAVVPLQPDSPKPLRNAILAGLLTLLLGSGIASCRA